MYTIGNVFHEWTYVTVTEEWMDQLSNASYNQLYGTGKGITALEWLRSNISNGGIYWDFNPSTGHIFFKYQSDAVLFKLTFPELCK